MKNESNESNHRAGSVANRLEKEQLLQQRGRVIWLFGLSGAGKSTLAGMLAGELHRRGVLAASLDGDELRAGLNAGLGFSEVDRSENLRRAAEVARLMVGSGLVTVCAFISPRRTQRALIRRIVGSDDLTLVFVSASVETCTRRDPKGLYARARAGQIAQFTGVGAEFELPEPDECQVVLDTEAGPAEVCLDRLMRVVMPLIRPGG